MNLGDNLGKKKKKKWRKSKPKQQQKGECGSGIFALAEALVPDLV